MRSIIFPFFLVGLLIIGCAEPNAPRVESGEVRRPSNFLFCFWNLENLFDDIDDNGRKEVDEEYNRAFAHDDKLRRQKYDHIAEALLRMNDGVGPDIIACAEVESVRAAELLMGVLNRKLEEAKKDEKYKYVNLAMKNLDAGRHIAPCVITRESLSVSHIRLHGHLQRILEVHVTSEGHELCLIASHWTSQLKQKDGSGGDHGRNKYADVIHERFHELLKQDPKVDFMVCGDFNDTPDSEPVVRGLHTVSQRDKLTAKNGESELLDLFAGKDREKFGTIWYSGKPLIYDQICVSSGMLDQLGWSCDPDSVKTFTEGLIQPGSRQHRPWRFSDPKTEPHGGRGYSDHFPITVRLTTNP